MLYAVPHIIHVYTDPPLEMPYTLRRGAARSERINDLDLRTQNVDAGSTAGYAARGQKKFVVFSRYSPSSFRFFLLPTSTQPRKGFHTDLNSYFFVFASRTMLLQVTQKCIQQLNGRAYIAMRWLVVRYNNTYIMYSCSARACGHNGCVCVAQLLFAGTKGHEWERRRWQRGDRDKRSCEK